jgi:hypothetical protein
MEKKIAERIGEMVANQYGLGATYDAALQSVIL